MLTSKCFSHAAELDGVFKYFHLFVTSAEASLYQRKDMNMVDDQRDGRGLLRRPLRNPESGYRLCDADYEGQEGLYLGDRIASQQLTAK